MAKVITKELEGQKYGIVPKKTMGQIRATLAELVQRRKQAEAAEVAEAAPSKKTRGTRAAPKSKKAGDASVKEQEVSDAPE